MLPVHILQVRVDSAARAPYNFVPLPERVVQAEEVAPDERVPPVKKSNGELQEFPYLVRQDTYHAGRYTGTIACTLTTASPIYVRCGYTPEEYAALGEKPFEELSPEERERRAQFFNLGDRNQPVIPGSSLRGMLRALVEIAAYGKMEKVSDRPRYFFRAVAAKTDDPLARPYRALFKNVRAGYLVRRGGAWLIRPPMPIANETFLKVRERDIPNSVGLIRMNNPHYRPQYIEVSFTHKRTPNGRTVVDRIDMPGVYPTAGWLVTSGNMIETGHGSARTNRQNHVVVPPAGSTELAIDEQAISDYCAGLSEFQKGPTDVEPASKRPFSERMGALIEGRPIFYCEPPRGEPVRFFGHSPNFRIPYWREDAKRAATPADFVPGDLKDPLVIDLAEAIFGFVRGAKREQEQAVAGRVFVGDALLRPGQTDMLYDAPLTPQILATPKPTTFQHYLVQTRAERTQTGVDRRGQPIYQLPLAHYGSQTPEETVVRGHKLYWHKGEHPSIGLPPEQIDTSESQKTLIRPVKPGSVFEFTIRFENLSKVELGAILWVLHLAADERYRLKLGMGKPLGMGAVRVEHNLTINQRASRYEALFDGDEWAMGDDASIHPNDIASDCINRFEGYVLACSGEKAERLEETLRIRCLLVLLLWPGPIQEQTRYMQIEYGAGKDNEYKNRPVLPSPLQIVGATDQELRPALSEQAMRPTSMHNVPPTPQRLAAPQLPSVGHIFTGLVLERDEQMVFVEVPGFSPEQVIGVLRVASDTPKWTSGKDRARVEVIGTRQKGQRTILDLKRGPKVEKK